MSNLNLSESDDALQVIEDAMQIAAILRIKNITTEHIIEIAKLIQREKHNSIMSNIKTVLENAFVVYPNTPSALEKIAMNIGELSSNLLVALDG